MIDKPFKKFTAGHQYPDLDMPVTYPGYATKSRRARARFRKAHGIVVRRIYRNLRKDMQRDGAIPGSFRVTYVEPLNTYHWHVIPMPDATPVDW